MKDKNTAGILALLLGGIGVHKFYLGQTGLGIVYLIFCWTFIPGIVGFIEGLILLTKSEEAFNAKYNRRALPAAPTPIVVNVAQQVGGGGQAAGGDLPTQLKSLHELKIAGALTEEEFAAEKAKLLTSGR